MLISSSLKSKNLTFVSTENVFSSFLQITVTPVKTLCSLPESSFIISNASALSFGLPRILPSMLTTVSAPIIVSTPFLKGSAFIFDRYSTALSGEMPFSSVSSTFAVLTSKSFVMYFKSSRLRGLCDAKIIICRSYKTPR